MRTLFIRPLLLLGLAGVAAAQDWVIPAGTTVVYDTSNGRVKVDNLVIETGAILRVTGPRAFALTAKRSIYVAGTLDLSGRDSAGVGTLNTTNQPEIGAAGSAGGGDGGVGSALTTQSTPAGGAGFGSSMLPGGGGQGGESGYSLGPTNARRGAGGGGGALGPDAPVSSNPDDAVNAGRIAEVGRDGTPTGLGALSQNAPPVGGAHGASAFVDAIGDNDFWGQKLDPGMGLIQGELSLPLAGRGGGAGGDAVQSATFPSLPFLPTGDEKGAGGGGGGGLGFLLTRRVVIAAGGRILANGGAGGGGENTNFFDRVGGGSGGGSGGYLVLQAYLFDLSQADDGALSALGGLGGPGAGNAFDATGGGGNGGPGVIQLHTPTGTDTSILLPVGAALSDISWPTAHVLLPAF